MLFLLKYLSSSSILGTIKTNNKFLGVASLITFDELAIMNLNPNKEIIRKLNGLKHILGNPELDSTIREMLNEQKESHID